MTMSAQLPDNAGSERRIASESTKQNDKPRGSPHADSGFSLRSWGFAMALDRRMTEVKSPTLSQHSMA
jgi:hypothetical protein